MRKTIFLILDFIAKNFPTYHNNAYKLYLILSILLSCYFLNYHNNTYYNMFQYDQTSTPMSMIMTRL